MSSNESLFVQTLRSADYSLTATRRQVFEALQLADGPLSMHQLVDFCRADRASVYRTIDLFEKLGIVQRLQLGWKYKLELSDNFSAHHHHAVCTHCGSILTLPEDSAFEKRITSLAAAQGFEVTGHQIELRGLCASCQTL